MSLIPNVDEERNACQSFEMRTTCLYVSLRFVIKLEHEENRDHGLLELHFVVPPSYYIYVAHVLRIVRKIRVHLA